MPIADAENGIGNEDAFIALDQRLDLRVILRKQHPRHKQENRNRGTSDRSQPTRNRNLKRRGVHAREGMDDNHGDNRNSPQQIQAMISVQGIFSIAE